MPKINDPSTAEALAREFCSNGRIKSKALTAIGYPLTTARAACGKMFRHKLVVAAIKRIDSKDAKRLEKKTLDLSRDSQYEKLHKAYKLAQKGKNPAAMISAVREQNEMKGYHRDKAPNAEKEAAKLARMTEEEDKVSLVVAKIRTDEESKGKVVKIGKVG